MDYFFLALQRQYTFTVLGGDWDTNPKILLTQWRVCRWLYQTRILVPKEIIEMCVPSVIDKWWNWGELFSSHNQFLWIYPGLTHGWKQHPLKCSLCWGRTWIFLSSALQQYNVLERQEQLKHSHTGKENVPLFVWPPYLFDHDCPKMHGYILTSGNLRINSSACIASPRMPGT